MLALFPPNMPVGAARGPRLLLLKTAEGRVRVCVCMRLFVVGCKLAAAVSFVVPS